MRYVKPILKVVLFMGSLIFILIKCAASENPLNKIGHHFERIKDIENKRSLNKIDNITAAGSMFIHVEALKPLIHKLSDNDPRKPSFESFIDKWDSTDKIYSSLNSGEGDFKGHVNYFFAGGYIKQKEGWKTLFPIFRP
jgi:hypothetical protein